jgi:hypothetical protein
MPLKQNQDGVSGVAVSLVMAIVLLLGAIGFGFWAYSSRQDYKYNVDAKIDDAVTVAKRQESIAKDKQFAEERKSPVKTYSGPQAYGSIVLKYPKTWSGYVADVTGDSGDGGTPLDGYFHPGVVPSTAVTSSTFSLRVQVLSQTYAQTLETVKTSLDSENPPTVKPYALPKVPRAVGVRITGTLPFNGGTGDKTGVMVILPLRSQTLQLWTEGSQFRGDFNKYVLPNFRFSP